MIEVESEHYAKIVNNIWIHRLFFLTKSKKGIILIKYAA